MQTNKQSKRKVWKRRHFFPCETDFYCISMRFGFFFLELRRCEVNNATVFSAFARQLQWKWNIWDWNLRLCSFMYGIFFVSALCVNLVHGATFYARDKFWNNNEKISTFEEIFFQHQTYLEGFPFTIAFWCCFFSLSSPNHCFCSNSFQRLIAFYKICEGGIQ